MKIGDREFSIKEEFLKSKSDVLVAAGVLVIIGMLIIPMPTFLLDMFMVINLVVNLMIVLIVLYTKKATDFSIFPQLLLVTTLFGLGLNVSSTRLILRDGINFDGAVINAFSTFVVGKGGTEGLVIGMIIFIIIIAVQFMVITKGASRVSEVAARFTLDAMPGKQMAIDQEFSQGMLTEDEARKKKKELQKESDFYGAMDGATKFVSGNVKVGILITLINIVGGLIVGVTIHKEPFSQALSSYIRFSIGDGLVSQFPALFISVATGLIVTRSISDDTFAAEAKQQFTVHAKIYWIGAVFLMLMAFIPGFPWYILVPMSVALGYVGYKLGLNERNKKTADAAETADKHKKEEPAELSPVIPVDAIAVELGYGLIPLVDKDQGADLLERITRIRKESALQYGLVVPRIRIIDNMQLDPSQYCIKIKGVEVGKGTLKTGHFLAIKTGSVFEELEGDLTTDPTFGLPALWITDEKRGMAERCGYTVVDGPSIIVTHLSEVIKNHAYELVGRQNVQEILDSLKTDFPAVVEEVRKTLSLGDIQKVLQGLLQENVSIRNMVPILETLADYGSVTRDVSFLVEKVRHTLRRQISRQYADENNTIHYLSINPSFEQIIIDSVAEDSSGRKAAGMEPESYSKFINSVSNSIYNAQQQGLSPVILTREDSRRIIKYYTSREIPNLIVLSVPEVSEDIRTVNLGEISI